MPTFYQRLQEYMQSPGAIQMSPVKINKLGNIVKHTYDKNKNKQPIYYVDSIENGVTYSVRHYPECFTHTIDGLIRTIAAGKKELIPTKLFIETTPPPKKIRTRKLIKSNPKPVFSTRLK